MTDIKTDIQEESHLTPDVRAVNGSRIKPAILQACFLAAWTVLALLPIFFPGMLRSISATSARGFSTDRALADVAVISRVPHAIGSQENNNVRDYIAKRLRDLGLEVEIQHANVVRERSRSSTVIGNVENVVARLKGSAEGKAVLLSAHYDSVSTGGGASDDAVAVASLLETARVLKHSAQRKHDIIILFTDGEEAGLLGARAFMAEHRWAQKVGVVFNFDARGTSGPVLMFETGPNNRAVIQSVAHSGADIMGNSLMFDIYSKLGNTTDFNIFRQAKLPGVNFAFIGGFHNYHSATDNISMVDPRTLQQLGQIATSLAESFADDVPPPAASSVVYWDILGIWLVTYSTALVLPLSIVICLLVASVITWGVRAAQIRVKRMLLGVLALLAALAAVYILCSLLVMAISRTHPSSAWYDNPWCALGTLIFVLALAVIIHSAIRRFTTGPEFLAAAVLLWMVLTVVATMVVPNGAYWFQWPLLLASVSLALAVRRRGVLDWSLRIGLSLCAVPIILLVFPMLSLITTGLTLFATSLLSVAFLLCWTLLILQLDALVVQTRWYWSAGMLIASIIILALAPRFDRASPEQRRDNLFYIADANRAFWASSDETLDAWTKQFIANNKNRTRLDAYFPGDRTNYMRADAPLASLPAPRLTVDHVSEANGRRTLELTVNSARGAPVLIVTIPSGVAFSEIRVGGRNIEANSSNGHGWLLIYYAPPPEGIRIALSVPAAKFNIMVLDQTYSLPDIIMQAYQKRPSNVVATPSWPSDVTFASSSFTL